MIRLLIAFICLSKSLIATEYDLVIVSGQSNAVGFNAEPSKLPKDPADAKVLFWWKTGDPPPDKHDSHSSNAWTTLKPQSLGDPAPNKSARRQYGNFAQADGGFGPEISFSRQLLKTDPDRKLAILKVAFSGTSIPTDWDPSKREEATSCYAALLEQFKRASAAAEKKGITLNLKGLIWIQGESDANKHNLPSYADDLTELVASMRKDLEAPNMLALFAVNTRFREGSNKYVAGIVEAQKAVAEADPNAAYVDTSKAPIANAAHYDTEGTLLVGKWFADAYLKHFKQK